jgi:hypothetical protein
VKAAPPDLEMNSHSEPTLMQGHAWENSGTVCLQRVWVKKGGQQQTTQVFLASDEDGVALLCLVLEESQQLLSFHLHNQEIVKDLNSKLKLEIAWTIPAISAAPVVATHPRVKNRGLPYLDILALTADGTLSLYVRLDSSHLPLTVRVKKIKLCDKVFDICCILEQFIYSSIFSLVVH